MDNQNQNNIQPQTNQVPEPASSLPVQEPQGGSAAMPEPATTSTAQPADVESSVGTPAVESTVQVDPTATESMASPISEPQTVIEPVVPGMEPTGAPVAQDSEANLGLSDESSANTPSAPATAQAAPENQDASTTPHVPSSGV